MKSITDTQPDSIVVSLSDRLMFSDHEDFRRVISTLVESDKANRVLDLKDLVSVDSAGLGMLVIAHEECQSVNAKLVFRGPTGQVRRMLELGRFDTILQIEG